MSLIRPRAASRRGNREDGEKPFWISFSDLMTALMVLFLVALTVALLAITHEISETEHRKTEQEQEISAFLARLQAQIQNFPGVKLRGSVIDFGDRARFETNSHRLSDSQAALLRSFVPAVLELARDPLGEKWLKRVVVEGFADARGGYLHNLDLSLRRSERVLCALLLPASGPEALAEADRHMVRELFLVSGASFNALKNSPEESRRIELRLEFREPDEAAVQRTDTSVDADLRCPLDRP
ncbi:flagellar motor protein MotB [Azonexus sp. IMCC34842]|uniref:flagellar motor protein MotB n=1 Tax=Azonexus sp. IMCC34842 TaxID=3420950 RepID=UPI003D13CCE5